MTITNIKPEVRHEIRHAVGAAMQYWPNAHLGDCSRRQDMRGAFMLIRSRIRAGYSINAAIGEVEMSAYRHANM
jgi:hypothetical protein